MGVKKKDDNEISYFIEDANFFALWYFTTPMFHTKDEHLTLRDISPNSRITYRGLFDFLRARLEMAGVEFPSIGSFSDVASEETYIPIRAEELKDHSEAEKKKIISASKKFIGDNFELKEFDLLTPFRYDLHSWIYIETDFSVEDVKKMKSHLDEYIDKFLNNELFVFDRNYLVFEKQKETFIEKVRGMSALEKYGENFVITNEDKPYGIAIKPKGKDGFLFIHTLYALQKLGYIGVMRIWSTGDSMSVPTYHANIVAFDPLIEEIQTSFRKENPETVFESYDEKHNVLKFAGKEIELSKKKKETDAVLLIKTLVKEPERYWFNDEVLEDWGYKEFDDTSKKKAYFSARKVNDLVKMETGVEDFIDHNTSKFRINPKYLKLTDS